MKSDEMIYVIGAGGHSKVVIQTILDAGHNVAGVFDDDPTAWGKSIAGFTVEGPVENLKKLGSIKAVIAIGACNVRRMVSEKLGNITWQTVIHPTAYIAADVQLGEGTVVFAQAAIQPGSTLGRHCIVNTSASIDHDCIIKDYVHLAPGSHLAGGISVGSETFIGIGANIIQYNKIGKKVIIGAGATVINEIPDGSTAVGVPARIVTSDNEK